MHQIGLPETNRGVELDPVDDITDRRARKYVRTSRPKSGSSSCQGQDFMCTTWRQVALTGWTSCGPTLKNLPGNRGVRLPGCRVHYQVPSNISDLEGVPRAPAVSCENLLSRRSRCHATARGAGIAAGAGRAGRNPTYLELLGCHPRLLPAVQYKKPPP